MTDIPALNLPAAAPDIRMMAEYKEVYDPLRRRWVALTPEEWVRQHFVAWLTGALGYPASLMANEVGLRLNGTLRRCDTIIYDRSLRPLVVVEYKAPSVTISQRAFDQIARYNLVLRARALMVSNGLLHYCCIYCPDGTYRFLSEVPSYGQLTGMLAVFDRQTAQK
ncbi:type I restriction enzyme HsdR N-terminal domain-containing protein [Paramuribaculum intestinale]|uniref:type I restriction enzyme HsdR N-terminal domain-containing protein n=1 Tax=Paramuribaculum intestinale TaxID=2094151 RepID=UPI0025A9A897|nr:type I restriction enzyme HsdR N-terminal domain-containing protein [Paramuribaculum intestinale]